jgi:hypothetical protein
MGRCFINATLHSISAPAQPVNVEEGDEDAWPLFETKRFDGRSSYRRSGRRGLVLADDVHGFMVHALCFMGTLLMTKTTTWDVNGVFTITGGQRALILYLYRPALLNHKP